MLRLDSWVAFVATVGVLVLSPGPSTLLAAANGMKHGAYSTLGTIGGDLSANVVQMTLAALGLGVVFLTSAELFGALKWLGVSYLIYLGLMRWRATPQLPDPTVPSTPTSIARLYVQGFMVSAANPKAVVFFAALFPLFLDPKVSIWPQLTVLGVTFVLMDGAALYLYARFAQRLRRWLLEKNRVRWQNRIVGSLLIGGGLALSFVKRD